MATATKPRKRQRTKGRPAPLDRVLTDDQVADGMPADRQSGTPRIIQLVTWGQHSGVKELAAITADLIAAEDRLAAFLDKHPPGHKCACCRAMADKAGGGFPTLPQQLLTIRCLLWSLRSNLECERPLTDTEYRALFPELHGLI